MSLSDPKHKKLLDAFIMEHAPLVNKIFHVLKSKGHLPQQVIEDPTGAHEAGFHGLMEALHLYKPEIAARTGKEGENHFVKYAESRIRGRMRDHAETFSEVPKNIRQQGKRLESMKAAPESSLNSPLRTPQPSDIAEQPSSESSQISSHTLPKPPKV